MRGSAFVLFVLAATAPKAHAFCGFFVAGNDAKLYNNASQVVLLRNQNHTVMTLQNNYQTVVTEYAWQTSSCDPCPTPPLPPGDLATLGNDGPSAKQQHGNYGFASWVLTRLHARYDKTTLSEDLIFKAAKPIMGGRAQWDGKSEGPTEPVVDSGENNFQARYIIRHYWTGPVKCASPQWGEWGGPPSGGESTATAAKGLASAARGAVKLDKVVRSPVPKLGLAGQKPPIHGH